MKEHRLIFVTVRARVRNILGSRQHHTVPAPFLKCDILFPVCVGSMLWKIYVFFLKELKKCFVLNITPRSNTVHSNAWLQAFINTED